MHDEYDYESDLVREMSSPLAVLWTLFELVAAITGAVGICLGMLLAGAIIIGVF
jgi:hypothetical protein